MIKLSDLLECVSPPDEQTDLMNLAIATAKRLEALDVPRVKAERKPLKGPEGNPRYILVDENSLLSSAYYMEHGNAERSAATLTKTTGQPHTVCQVMAPESGECPTIPVATFTPTPERPHEWVVYSTNTSEGRHWHSHCPGDTGNYWHYSVTDQNVKRFATFKEAQSWIESRDIADAYPWPVPKLTTAS